MPRPRLLLLGQEVVRLSVRVLLKPLGFLLHALLYLQYCLGLVLQGTKSVFLNPIYFLHPFPPSSLQRQFQLNVRLTFVPPPGGKAAMLNSIPACDSPSRGVVGAVAGLCFICSSATGSGPPLVPGPGPDSGPGAGPGRPPGPASPPSELFGTFFIMYKGSWSGWGPGEGRMGVPGPGPSPGPPYTGDPWP